MYCGLRRKVMLRPSDAVMRCLPHVPPLTHHCRRQHHLAQPNITCLEGANIIEKSSLSAAFFLVGDGGFAFLRKSHGGCDMPPACCQEPPFESTITNTHTKIKDPSSRMSLFSWWGMVDSNHRRRCQQIYSLSPLATREIPHILFNPRPPFLASQTSEAFVTRKGKRRERMWSFPRLAGSGTQRASFDVELVDGFEPPTC